MKRILVIRFSALGDVAMLAPIVRAAAEESPDTEFTVLSQKRMRDLFAGMPGNVIFHGVDLKKQSLREIADGLGRFDAVADMHGVWRSLYIRMRMRLRGAKVATIDKGRWDKWRLTHGLIHRPLTPTAERYKKVFAGLYLPITDRERTGNEPATDRRGWGVAPFAAHEGKIYPLERMERVVEQLSKTGERVVLFGGGKKEQAILERWAEKYQGVESVAGKYSLAQELEIMRRLRGMVSMDSANMHLASLVGTRVVSIWGATHPKAGFLGFGQSESDCVQRELKCRPCSIYGNKRCKFGDYRCMDISPDEIVEKVKSEE